MRSLQPAALERGSESDNVAFPWPLTSPASLALLQTSEAAVNMC